MRLAGSRGQALTEFVIIIPLFLFLLLGVVQLGLIFFAYQTVHYASFAACRAALVRPCMAFHPDDALAVNFTPTVFTAAVLGSMVTMPSQDLFGDNPFPWMPPLPATVPVTELDFDDVDPNIREYKYGSAALLTAVRRVVPVSIPDPPAEPDWQPTAAGPGQGIPCMDNAGVELNPGQNVPPPGDDVTLEVTVLYPMIIPLVNRVFYGVFINFSEIDDLVLPALDPLGEPEDVMVRPTKILPLPGMYRWSMNNAVPAMLNAYGFSGLSRITPIADRFADRAWYPLPVRARATLTVEAAIDRMMMFP